MVPGARVFCRRRPGCLSQSMAAQKRSPQGIGTPQGHFVTTCGNAAREVAGKSAAKAGTLPSKRELEPGSVPPAGRCCPPPRCRMRVSARRFVSRAGMRPDTRKLRRLKTGVGAKETCLPPENGRNIDAGCAVVPDREGRPCPRGRMAQRTGANIRTRSAPFWFRRIFSWPDCTFRT